jgi:hypothetical protein
MTKNGQEKNHAKDIYKQDTTYLYEQNMYFITIIKQVRKWIIYKK